jgi:hypothetical protein
MIELFEAEDGAGADFGLELALSSAEESFDESAGRGIAHAAVDQPDVELKAGGLERVRVIDLGVVQVSEPQRVGLVS